MAVGPGVVPRNDANVLVAPEAEAEIAGAAGWDSNAAGAPKAEVVEPEEKKLELDPDPNPLKPPILGTGGACGCLAAS